MRQPGAPPGTFLDEAIRQPSSLSPHTAPGGKTAEIVSYPDAPHGFHADYRPSYRKDPAEAAWSRMLAWFKQYGVA